jgi:hypothetical protein
VSVSGDAPILDDQIRAFGSLVSLVLALATGFTVQRSAAMRERFASASITESRAQGALLLDIALFILTAGLFAAGLPLWVDALDELHFLRAAGAIRSAFFVVWLLLAGLLGWQAWLLRKDVELMRKL